MPYTTAEAVQALLEFDSDINVDQFIETANLLVRKYCSDSGYETDQLELIERWLAAHFYCIRSPQFENQSVMSAAKSFNFQPGFGLQLTRYGAQALLLDTAGGLAQANKPDRIRVGINYLGIPPCENPRDPRYYEQ